MARFLLAIVFLFPAIELQAADSIRVGSWNIKTLGSPDSRDYPQRRPSHGKGVERDPADLAETINGLDVDVLALQEIDDNDGDFSTRTNSILDATFEMLNEGGEADWHYELFAGPSRNDKTQLTGMAWDANRVDLVTRRLRIPVADITSKVYAEWDRSPHAMLSSRGEGRSDFVVIPVHMKAGGGGGAREQREREAESLIRELDEVREHFEDDDIIIIGDFNMGSRDEDSGGDFRGSGKMFDLNFNDTDTHVSNRPLDRCYVPKSQREDGKEFAEATLEIHTPSDSSLSTFRRDQSDHWPVVLVFEEQEDDD